MGSNPGGYPNQGGYNPPPSSAPSSGLDDNLAGALCYMPFLLGLVASIVFLVLEPYSKNRLIRFHAFQSIFLTAGMFVAGFVVGILLAIIALVPVVGPVISFVGMLIWPLIGFAGFFLFLFLMYKTYNNQRVVLPVVGAQAEKQA